ncbi:hypothetical protein [Methylobacter sp.]
MRFVPHRILPRWGILAPGARFEWVHQFEDSARAIQSQFVSS